MPCHLLSSSPSLRPFVTSSSPFVISSVPPDRREGEEEDKWRKTERRRGKGRASCRSLVSSPLPFTYSSLSPVPFVPSSFGPSRPRSFLTSVARFLTSSGTTGRKNDGTEWRWKGTEDDRSPATRLSLSVGSYLPHIPVGRSFTRFFVSLRLSLHLTHFSRRYGGKGEAGTREAKM